MATSTDTTAPQGSSITPGTVPAWAVEFVDDASGEPVRTVGSDTYYGSLTATMPSGLAGGAYEIVVEGMTDEDYRKIHRPAGAPLTARLSLWWKDDPTGIAGDLARFTGLDHPLGAITPDPPPDALVAVLRVDRVFRRAGARRVEVVVKARERVVARLDERRVEGRCFVSMAASITGPVGDAVELRGHRLDEAVLNSDQATFVDVSRGSALEVLHTQLGRLQQALGLYGLPPAMIRDGRLDVGEWTSPLGAPPLDALRSLDDGTGLLLVDRGPARDRDRQAGPAGGAPAGPASRLTVSVTCAGRPDLKPGDVVSMVLPPEDFPVTAPTGFGTLLTSGLGIDPGDLDPNPKPSYCRIVELTHTLSRQQGFLTTFQGIVLAPDDTGTGVPTDDGWDRRSPQPAERDDATTAPPPMPFSSPSGGVAAAVDQRIRTVLDRALGPVRNNVAVVHDHAVSADVPRHTSDLWDAAAAPDGLPGAAQRVEITPEQHGERRQIPYATPFAWGGYGLVLPRYPGTRVLLANAGGGAGDYVDIGALWPLEDGPAAQPGDYWLALPVGIAAERREHLPASGEQLPSDGPATHDLIDADGTRVVETARFVLRVRDRDGLTAVPDRPAPGDDAPAGSVLIETRKGSGDPARILLKDDGSVTITATSITFDTAGRGDIELKADNVRVSLAGNGTMDVS